MIYQVYNESSILYEGNDFREAFLIWNNNKGNAKINVPINALPKLNTGDDFYDNTGNRYIVDDYNIKNNGSVFTIDYHAFDEQGRKKIFSSSEISKFSGGGIVEDYHRIKEGLIFKNEYLAQLVEQYLGETPEFWFERVGAMIYTTNKSYLNMLESNVREILTKIEGNTNYVSKMINDKPIQKFNFEVEYDSGKEIITIMAFSEQEAKKVAFKKMSEKTQITGKKIKKIQILAPQI
jgi:hypothetical protein